MPIYVYQCPRCEVRSEIFSRRMTAELQVPCAACGAARMDRVFTPFAIYRSEIDQINALDPKYFKMVDQAIANTPEADPERHLRRMIPFSAADDPGDPITF